MFASCGILFVCSILFLLFFLNRPQFLNNTIYPSFSTSPTSGNSDGKIYVLKKGVIFVPVPFGWDSAYSKSEDDTEMIRIASADNTTVNQAGIIYAKKASATDESIKRKTNVAAILFLENVEVQDLQVSKMGNGKNYGYCTNMLTDHNLDSQKTISPDEYRYAQLCTYVVPTDNNEDVLILASIILSKEKSSEELSSQKEILNNLRYSLE